jgi:hypothetical protein
MRVARFNDFPHPRILFENIPDDAFAAMEPYAGHARRVTAEDHVDIGEFDLLVTWERSGLLQVWLTRSFRPRVRPVG